MFGPSCTIYVAVGAVKLCWSFDLLAGIVRERLGRDPRSGDLFIFINARRTMLKALFYDRGGFCVLHKRLDEGRFPMPEVTSVDATYVMLSGEQLELLLRGLAPVRRREKEHRSMH